MSTILATVENGVIHLPADAHLPDGTAVRVEAVEPPPAPAEAEANGAPGRTLADHLAPWIGIAEGLPSDFAINHDHYIHGTRKQQPWNLFSPTLFTSWRC